MRMCIRPGFWGAVAECVGIPRWHALILVKWLVCDLLTRSYIGLLIWCTLLIRFRSMNRRMTNQLGHVCLLTREHHQVIVYSSSSEAAIYVAPGLVINLRRCLSKQSYTIAIACVTHEVREKMMSLLLTSWEDQILWQACREQESNIIQVYRVVSFSR